MIVEDFMTRDVFTCVPDDTIEQAARIMSDKGISVLPIVGENHELLGMITESDFVGKEIDIPHALVSLKMLFGKVYHLTDVENVYQQAKKTKIKKVMSKKIRTVKKESNLSEVVDLMVSNHLKRLPVVENKKLIGIITRKDILKAFANS